MTDRKPSRRQLKQARRPPRPKLPENPTARELHTHVAALYDHATALAREEPISVWKERIKTRHSPLGAANVKPVEAVRHLYSLRASDGVLAKRCTRLNRKGTPCRMIAVRGMEVCYFHGGRAEIERRRIALGIPPKTIGHALGGVRRTLGRNYLLPDELLRHPVYVAVTNAHEPMSRHLQRLLILRLAGNDRRGHRRMAARPHCLPQSGLLKTRGTQGGGGAIVHVCACARIYVCAHTPRKEYSPSGYGF